MGKAIMLNWPVLRARLIELLKNQPLPINSCQVCRIYQGKNKNDIKFCRNNPIQDVTANNWERNNNLFYENCINCSPNHKQIYAALCQLQEKGYLDGRTERRLDPQKAHRGMKDKMRMWAIKGGLPSMDPFIE